MFYSRLGHGDTTSYVNPKLVEALKDDIIFELSCGCWHSVAVVLIPPLLKGGLVCSFYFHVQDDELLQLLVTHYCFSCYRFTLGAAGDSVRFVECVLLY